tara:strand:+ start:73 stop:3378 length:3306 start_codon:yes stop_codon:yes gene_type:complete
MQNTKLLLIILEFEKDLKDFLSSKNIFNDEESNISKLKKYKDRVDSRRSHKANINKTDIDLLTINECGELLSLHANIITPEFKKNIGDYKQIIEEVTQLRNTLVHPFSVENEFEDLDIPYSTVSKIYEGIEKYTKLDNFEWKRVKNAFIKINSPEFFLLSHQEIIKDIVYPILHNLPDSQHKITQFIGRSKELDKLKILLKNERFPLLSICGPGGSGKTALILEACNQLIDTQDDFFNKIIFYTMKTEDLLEKIDENRDSKLDSLIDTIENDFEVILDNENALIEYIDTKETLLILDNTDNLSIDEIINFYEKFQHCKIVITSRIGLGQIEKRIELDKYDLDSGMFLYTKLIELNHLEHTNEDLSYDEQKSIIKKLETPLGIKFLIQKLLQGTSNKEILDNLDELYEFCSKGIFTDLTENTKTILACMVKANGNLNIGDIVLATNFNIDDITESLRQLERRGLLFKKNIKQDIYYEINDISKTYYEKNKNHFITISKKLGDVESKILTLKEKTLIINKTRSFNARHIWIDSENKSDLLISDLLNQALDERSMNNKATDLIENAKNINRNFSEIYRIEAFLYSKKGMHKEADKSYLKSIELSQESNTDYLGASAYWYAGHLFRNTSNLQEALHYAKIANDLFPKEYIQPQRQYASILNATGQYDKALSVLNNLDIEYKDKSVLITLPVRQVLSLILEINRRKFIETISIREKQSDYAFECIVEFLETNLPIFLSITNDRVLPVEIKSFFAESDRFVISFLTPEVNNDLIEKYISLRKTLPIYLQNNKERENIIESYKNFITNLEELSYIKNIEKRIFIYEEFIDYLIETSYENNSYEIKEFYCTGYINPNTRGDDTFQCTIFNDEMNKLPINIRGNSKLILNEDFKFGDKISCIISIHEDGTKEIIDIDKLESNNNKEEYDEDRFITISLNEKENFCIITDLRTGMYLGKHSIKYIENILPDFKYFFHGARFMYFIGTFKISQNRVHFNEDSIKPITTGVLSAHISSYFYVYLLFNSIENLNNKLNDLKQNYEQLKTGEDYKAKCIYRSTFEYENLTFIATGGDVKDFKSNMYYLVSINEIRDDGKIFCFVKRKLFERELEN